MNISEAIDYKHLNRKSLLEEIASRDEKIVRMGGKIQELEEQLAWFKRQIFGERSERVVSNLNAEQLVFEGFENLATKEIEKKTVAAHERKKPNRDGKDKISLPEDLPVKTTILDIPE